MNGSCVAVIAGPQAGWVQGGSLKPPFLPIHTQPSYTMSICKWPASLTAIENHCCPNKFVEEQWMCVECTTKQFTPL